MFNGFSFNSFIILSFLMPYSCVIDELYYLFFVCSLTTYLRVYEHTVPGPKKLKRLGVELGTIYVKASRDLSYETDEDFAKLCSVIQPSWQIDSILLIKVPKPLICCIHCTLNLFRSTCYLAQVCDLFRSKRGSVILEELVIPLLQLL